jgi:hypothetical protein
MHSDFNDQTYNKDFSLAPARMQRQKSNRRNVVLCLDKSDRYFLFNLRYKGFSKDSGLLGTRSRDTTLSKLEDTHDDQEYAQTNKKASSPPCL